MPTYIGLYKLTDQRVKNIKDAPARLDAAFKGCRKNGWQSTWPICGNGEKRLRGHW